MYKIIILFCIFANFWGCYLVVSTGILPDENYIVSPNKYYDETIVELLLISIVLIAYSLISGKVTRHKISIKATLKNERFIYYLYIFFIISSFLAINFSGDNSARGEGQFELTGRGGLSGLFSSVQMFYVPFYLFLLIAKPFKEKNTRFVLFFTIVFLISGVTGGGRRNLIYLSMALMLYYYYYKNLKIGKIMILALPLLLLFPIAIAMRNEDALLFVLNNASPLALFSEAFILANSDPSFLWAVKSYVASGITLSPFSFSMHFISLLVPSFVYVVLFNKISYERSVFLFDNLFNSNPNQGYDFMLLADFYWCFGYVGYILYILMVIWCMKYFKKNIYSPRFYKIAGAFLAVIFICQQRNDFGAVLKPFVYCLLFAYILDRVFIKKLEIIKES